MATTNHSGSLKRNAPPLATFRAPASSSTSTASNSPTVASISSQQQPSSITLPRPGILKPTSMKLERHEATTSTAGLYPDVTPSSGTTTTSAAGCVSSSSGVCAVPNCPPANCSGGGRPSTTSTTSLIRHQTTNGTSETTTMAFNSSCQQCIAERAAVGSTNSAINSTISK